MNYYNIVQLVLDVIMILVMIWSPLYSKRQELNLKTKNQNKKEIQTNISSKRKGHKKLLYFSVIAFLFSVFVLSIRIDWMTIFFLLVSLFFVILIFISVFYIDPILDNQMKGAESIGKIVGLLERMTSTESKNVDDISEIKSIIQKLEKEK